MSPASKSEPTILSMSMNTENALLGKPFWPLITHVTRVSVPAGSNRKTVPLVASNGFSELRMIRSGRPLKAAHPPRSALPRPLDEMASLQERKT